MFQSVSKSPSKRRGSLERRTSRWWRRCGSKENGFWYETADGKRVSKSTDLERIRGLVIPPAWSNVRISPKAGGRLQAIGYDSRGRAQYMYHPAFVDRRAIQKFSKIPLLARYLGLVRRRTGKHASGTAPTKEVVLGAIVRVIHDLHFRVGSERSAQVYRTYGITTLQSRHAVVRTNAQGKPIEVEFNFVGKHHIRQRKVLRDPKLAELIVQLKSLRGSRLFKYITDEGRIRSVTPKNVNDYIRQLTTSEFTAKDFRTWAATLHAARALAELGVADTKTETKRRIVQAIRTVAERLGNTVSVCRKSYIHPAVIRAFELGRTLNDYSKNKRTKRMRVEEAALVRMLTTPLPPRR